MGSFINKVKEKFVVIGVIGQGYVGLPLALVFSEAGFQVLGFDVDGGKIATLKRGESYIRHVGPARVAAAVKSGRFSATDDFDCLRECDAMRS
jgi:UDP-N-acetyl-D-glucosamine dehydrogenase